MQVSGYMPYTKDHYMKLKLIYAQSSNGVIGDKGKLPWHLPEDLQHFKEQTNGCPVIMGRKTWDSLPTMVRPLPGRKNIVLTNTQSHAIDLIKQDAIAAISIVHAMSICAQVHAPNGWVIGGAEILKLAIPWADEIIITHVDLECEGDTMAPKIDTGWMETKGTNHKSATGIKYSIITYKPCF